MPAEACNYKNFPAAASFLMLSELDTASIKSHACKFSTLWITPVDNHFGTMRHSNTAAARYRWAHHLIRPSPSSYHTFAGAHMRAKKKSIRRGMLLE